MSDDRYVVPNHRSTDCLLTFSSDKQHRNIKGPYCRPFVKGIHRWRVDSSHKGTVTQNTFSFDDVTLSIQEAWWHNKLRCNLNSRPRNTSFGAHNWNAHRSTPNKHVKREWCETIGKCFDKMTWIMIYLGAQNDPEIGPLGSIFNTLLKVSQIDMYTKTDAQPVGNIWENDQRPEFWLIWGPKVAPKLGLWGPYSPHI